MGGVCYFLWVGVIYVDIPATRVSGVFGFGRVVVFDFWGGGFAFGLGVVWLILFICLADVWVKITCLLGFSWGWYNTGFALVLLLGLGLLVV